MRIKEWLMEEEEAVVEENMEEEAALIPLSEKEKTVGRKAFVGEVKEVNRIALPMIVVTVSQYLLRASPMLMLGHLGEFPLSSASIATSLCNVTGYSVLVTIIISSWYSIPNLESSISLS